MLPGLHGPFSSSPGRQLSPSGRRWSARIAAGECLRCSCRLTSPLQRNYGRPPAGAGCSQCTVRYRSADEWPGSRSGKGWSGPPIAPADGVPGTTSSAERVARRAAQLSGAPAHRVVVAGQRAALVITATRNRPPVVQPLAKGTVHRKMMPDAGPNTAFMVASRRCWRAAGHSKIGAWWWACPPPGVPAREANQRAGLDQRQVDKAASTISAVKVWAWLGGLFRWPLCGNSGAHSRRAGHGQRSRRRRHAA